MCLQSSPPEIHSLKCIPLRTYLTQRGAWDLQIPQDPSSDMAPPTPSGGVGILNAEVISSHAILRNHYRKTMPRKK